MGPLQGTQRLPANSSTHRRGGHEPLPDPLDWAKFGVARNALRQSIPDMSSGGNHHADRPAAFGQKGIRGRVRSAHFVGMTGSGMRALAELMQDFGCRITGSDLTLTDEDRWQMHSRGLRICAGHAVEHLPASADVLIHSPAVPVTNPERAAARRLEMPQLSLPQALGLLMRSRKGISVAGTHGKTTTTALLGHLLGEAGCSPSVVCGGFDRARQSNGWAGRGQLMVVESCEYRRHFLNLAPHHAILLNIEPDHFDCFASLEESISAYQQFVARLPSAGTIVVNRDSPAATRALERTTANVITFGQHRDESRHGPLSPSADWSYRRLRQTVSGWSFIVERNGEVFGRFRLTSPLRHNVLNALAGIALGHHLGIPRHRLQLGLRSFAGVGRRFEQFDLGNGITLIDDYAHHPSAIAGVLAAARQRFPNRRLWCAFQPHQVSRTRALLREFAVSLAGADVVLVPPVFTAREQPGSPARHWARELVRLLQRQGKQARSVESLDEIRRTIETEAAPGDLILTLGAGDIDAIAASVSRRVPRPRAS